jgi:hypothetical protein
MSSGESAVRGQVIGTVKALALANWRRGSRETVGVRSAIPPAGPGNWSGA